jgi:DNA-binding SARP family transcriptional activator
VKAQYERKLRRPGLPEWVVARPRVNLLLEEAFSRFDVVELAGTAGSGKTITAELFAARSNMPTAWLNIDSGDRSGRRLVAYLARALAVTDRGAVRAAHDALRRGSTAPEAAALLASHLGNTPVLIVFDDCEEIAGKEEAVSVLTAFVTYLPPTARVLLLSREPFDSVIAKIALDGRVARVNAAALAFDLHETSQFLIAAGRPDVEAATVIEAIGGWAAGLIVGTWLAANDGGQCDLGGYLKHEILDCLSPAEQDFLLRTSVLDVVSPDAAARLCGPHAPSLLHRISQKRLPGTITQGEGLTYYPFFKNFLESELHARIPDEVPELRRLQALVLADRGELEEAVEILLGQGEMEDAAEVATRAVGMLCDRGDWSLLCNWLERLGPKVVDANPRLLGAKIRALTHGRRLPEAQTLIRDAHRLGMIGAVAEVDAGVVAHVGWAFMCRPDEGISVIDSYPQDHRAAAVRYTLQVLSGHEPAAPPPGREFGDVERVMTWGLFVQGRLDTLADLVPSPDRWPPTSFYHTPHSLLGLIWRGELSLVHQLWDQVPLDVRARTHADLWRNLEAWILLADGDVEGAVAAGQEAVAHSQRTRFGWEPYLQLVVGLSLIRLGRLGEARCVLAEALQRAASAGQLAYVEWAQAYQGLAQLLSGEHARALRTLRECVASMRAAGRVLNLPAALAYLSEAEARAGSAEAAVASARLASAAAADTHSAFPLQQALIDVPGVSERLGASAARVKPGRSEIVRGYDLEVNPFGLRPDLSVDGAPCGIRRLKVIELAAYLALRGGSAPRSKIQLDLFPEHDLHAGGNYFRQVVHQFRRATGIALVRLDHGMIGLPPGVILTSTDAAVEGAASGEIRDRQKLDEVLQLVDRTQGVYLDASTLKWADDRRFELDVLQERLLRACAIQALAFGRFDVSEALARQMLDADPCCEDAFRVLDAAAAQSGRPEQREIVYRKAKAALAEVGVEPEDIGLAAPRKQSRAAAAGR